MFNNYVSYLENGEVKCDGPFDDSEIDEKIYILNKAGIDNFNLFKKDLEGERDEYINGIGFTD